MPVPQNAETIYNFLRSHGYSHNAAAGILGNIEQESTGNPEAGGPGNAGIIQWTPASKARPFQPIQTGNPARDLQTQLKDMLTYNNNQGSLALQQLNAARSPSEAAVIYQNLFERPAPATENQANRIASAEAVARAAQTGNWKSTTTGSTGGGGGGFWQQFQIAWQGIVAGTQGTPEGGKFAAINAAGQAGSGVAGAIGGLTAPFARVAQIIDWWSAPNHIIRVFAGVGGGILVAFGLLNLSHAGKSSAGISEVGVNIPLPSGELAAALGILEVGIGSIGLFIAFHNLPASVSTPGELIGYLQGKVK